MEQQNQRDHSIGLKKEIAELRADLAEVKQLLQQFARHVGDKSSLTDQVNVGYYSETTLNNQGKNLKEAPAIYDPHRKPIHKPNQIPHISEGESATCTRCQHTWIPYVRRPKKCPSCRQAWYKPKAWTRTKSLTS